MPAEPAILGDPEKDVTRLSLEKIYNPVVKIGIEGQKTTLPFDSGLADNFGNKIVSAVTSLALLKTRFKDKELFQKIEEEHKADGEDGGIASLKQQIKSRVLPKGRNNTPFFNASLESKKGKRAEE